MPFTCVPKQGYFLEVVSARERYEHFLAGEHDLPGAFCLRGVACTLCGKDSPFIASIANETGGKENFYGQPYLQTIFHYCMPRHVVTAYLECD